MKLIAFVGAKGSPGTLKINPDNVTCISQADAAGPTPTTTVGLTRIWVNGGDYFTVHGTLDEVEKALLGPAENAGWA